MPPFSVSKVSGSLNRMHDRSALGESYHPMRNTGRATDHLDLNEDLSILCAIDLWIFVLFEGFTVFSGLRCSCGSCGYELNLSSSNRNTSNFGSKYGKAIKKGFISFLAIDESRFSKKEECRCVPYFISKRSWGIFRRRTKLLCQKCGNLVGVAYEEDGQSCAASESSGAAVRGKYKIKIRALQPLTDDEPAVPFSHGGCRENVASSSVD